MIPQDSFSLLLLLLSLASLINSLPQFSNHQFSNNFSIPHHPHHYNTSHQHAVTSQHPHNIWPDNGTLQHTNSDLGNSLSRDKDGKFIFTVIQFPNVLCGSGIDSGTCFTTTECALNGGTRLDQCARGYGTCCQVKKTDCGGTVSVNNTIITNSEYDGTFNEARNCLYKVEFDDTTNEICQIKYEFIDFDFVAPSTNGICENDKLVFENDGKSEYFCGKAPSDYHWYVETVGTTSPQSLSISTDGSNYDRKYAIRITTIPCMREVPTYCGQFYDGTSGTVASFNYGNGVYLAGLMYSVCFQKYDDRCTYTLSPTDDKSYIGTPDQLRLPMGEEISLVGNPSIAGSTAICPSTGTTAVFYSVQFCLYPDSFTSVNLESPFYISVKTDIDTNANRNNLDTTMSGYSFDWTANTC